jgi:hypothetical protein
MPDCGDNSCRYSPNKGGMRTNGGCRCDECPECGAHVRPDAVHRKHRAWCPHPSWLPPHHRAEEKKA